MSSYQDALAWIRKHPGTSSASRFAKLILSLWNAECGLSFRECIHNLDEARTALALRRVKHLAAAGEDADLVAARHEVCREYPRLWDLGHACDQVKHALRGAKRLIWATSGVPRHPPRAGGTDRPAVEAGWLPSKASPPRP
jgi:hypothetical protein